MPRHQSMPMVLMSMVLQICFMCCSPYMRSFKKTSATVDTTNSFCSAPGLRHFWTKILHMSSSKCSSSYPLPRPSLTMDFTASSVNFNFTNISATFNTSPVNTDQCAPDPCVPGAMVSVSRSTSIQGQCQFNSWTNLNY